MLKKILQFKLKILAKLVLLKYRPKVVGITGSVGKTSAKNSINAVLSTKFRVNKSLKNYNNEIGLPLSILSLETAGSSIIGWLKIFWQAVKLLLIKDKNYPEILVLEMGVDRPGDMDYLNSIVRCDVGVITAIGASHLEFFKSIEGIRKEKSKLISNLKDEGVAILNIDDLEIKKIIPDCKNKILTYGQAPTADVQSTDIVFDLKTSLGINSNIRYNKDNQELFLPNTIGYPAVYAALAAIAVGVYFDLELSEICSKLKNHNPAPGRMRIIAGINDSVLIDDTYNASPQSALEALKAIKDFSGYRKIAILGDMLELGDYTESGHQEVGSYAVEVGVDMLIAVGKFGNFLIAGAEKAGLSADNIFYFKNSDEAVIEIEKKIQAGDLVLIKGSQGARMDKVTKALIKNKEQAGELLVRQDKSWI